MNVNVVPIGCGSMDYAFRLQHTVAFRQASLFVFITLRTHEPLLTRALLHKKIVGIKAKSKSKIRIKPNLESNLNRVA